MAHNYILQVTAGHEYDTKTHKIVPVNQPSPVSISSDLIDADVNVRIQSYRGLPRNSPTTSPYFSLPTHAKNNDQYSICFRFSLKKPISGKDLVFGNDFDHPIRDRLPPGFGTAFRIVKWMVDPGLEGDVYADMPYLYGAAGGSFATVWVGSKGDDDQEKEDNQGVGHHEEIGLVFEEGGDEEGLEVRRENGVPETDAAARRKHFLDEQKKEAWEWEEGRTYGVDFYNPYLDFNEFALRLPGFTLPIMKYWDGQGLRKQRKRSHTLRYVLKNKATNEVLLVVLFTLYLKEDIDEEGNIKPGVVGGKPFKGTAKGYGSDEDEEEDEDADDEDDDEDADDEDDDEEDSESGEDDNVEKRKNGVLNGADTSADDID
ncbi:hypothetical protein F5884DRAFT_725640 [Xylogone sp. PMI_703]|nr:hypothetical protein F5884DRAFT_725640 [Xylogone sp. PMI_703]